MSACAYCRPPELSPGQVSRLVTWLFPTREVVEDSVKPLPSYEDRNFYLKARTREDSNDNATSGYVLKVYNSTTTQELAAGISSVLTYLKSRGFACPVPVTNREGGTVLTLFEAQILLQDAAVVRSTRKPKFCTVLLTYISGTLFEKVVSPSPQLLYDVAKYVGEIDAALQGFSHPVLDNREFSEPCWDLRQLHHLRKYLPSIRDPRNRTATETVLKNFSKHVAPKIPSMRTGIIWGDAHQDNIVVEDRPQGTVDGKQAPSFQLAGVIDFADCSNTCCVFELATMLAHFMQNQEDPIRFACPLVSGYLHAFPLDENELDCLYHLVLARLCLATTMTEHQYNQESWNSYLGEKISSGWELVHTLLSKPKEAVDRVWSEAWKQGVD